MAEQQSSSGPWPLIQPSTTGGLGLNSNLRSLRHYGLTSTYGNPAPTSFCLPGGSGTTCHSKIPLGCYSLRKVKEGAVDAREFTVKHSKAAMMWPTLKETTLGWVRNATLKVKS
ncbi:hypothetical protein CRM22_003165 [Opisthorchis felineus]|uniref:Uncharacterized protein n=1 Tax=Opisthorchis felineus TaxID=147828 RepID=A0A4S2M347_OPIFE|nr:hypothetical protein CRM22_003165 [Opisthorchis felineus]